MKYVFNLHFYILDFLCNHLIFYISPTYLYLVGCQHLNLTLNLKLLTFFFFYVHAENKQDMSDTSITLSWSAISSVSFFPVDIYRLWVSHSGRFGPGRGYLQKGLRSLSQRNLSKSQIW